jgi:hypothetical protein
MTDGKTRDTAGAASPAVRGAGVSRREPSKTSPDDRKAVEHHGAWDTLDRWEKATLVLSYLGDIDQWHGPQGFHEKFVEYAETAMRWALAESRSRTTPRTTVRKRKRARSA